MKRPSILRVPMMMQWRLPLWKGVVKLLRTPKILILSQPRHMPQLRRSVMPVSLMQMEMVWLILRRPSCKQILQLKRPSTLRVPMMMQWRLRLWRGVVKSLPIPRTLISFRLRHSRLLKQSVMLVLLILMVMVWRMPERRSSRAVLQRKQFSI